MRPPNKEKGKAIATTSKKLAIAAEEIDKMRDDAYKLAIEGSSSSEYQFSYIPVTYQCVTVIEPRYAALQAYEIASLYIKENANFGMYPKDFHYYEEILIETGSVKIQSYQRDRSSNEWAYAKFQIKKIITLEQWGDMYTLRELKYPSNPRARTYCYVDYIQAWNGALYYENKHHKFSWWIQLNLSEETSVIPSWFLQWFWDWGIFPICMPNKVRTVYEQFVEANPGLQHPRGLIRVVPPKKQLPPNEEKPSLPNIIKNLLKDVPKDVLKSELLKALEDGMSDDHSENSVNKDEEDGSLNDDLLDEDQPYEDMETNNGGDDA
ncbi:hypothetical protein LINPERHAP2_LOCUS166 [Linum perenne]